MYQNIKVSNKITAFFSTGICGSVAPPPFSVRLKKSNPTRKAKVTQQWIGEYCPYFNGKRLLAPNSRDLYQLNYSLC